MAKLSVEINTEPCSGMDQVLHPGDETYTHVGTCARVCVHAHTHTEFSSGNSYLILCDICPSHALSLSHVAKDTMISFGVRLCCNDPLVSVACHSTCDMSLTSHSHLMQCSAREFHLRVLLYR